MPKVVIGIIVLAVIGFFLYSQNSSKPSTESQNQQTAQEPDGSYTFEVISLKDKPAGNSYVIVASQTQDVREQLPISIEYLKNGKSVWAGVISGDPAKVCRDKTGCGVDGPNIKDLNLMSGDSLEMVAKGKDGTVLAKDSASTPK